MPSICQLSTTTDSWIQLSDTTTTPVVQTAAGSAALLTP